MDKQGILMPLDNSIYQWLTWMNMEVLEPTKEDRNGQFLVENQSRVGKTMEEWKETLQKQKSSEKMHGVDDMNRHLEFNPQQRQLFL